MVGAVRPLKRRASSNCTAGESVAEDHSFQLTFASPSAAPSDLPSSTSTSTTISTLPTQGALALQPTISFAPNITPGTYTAPPPSDDDLLNGLVDGADGCESTRTTLFPDASGNDPSSLTNHHHQPATKRRRKNNISPASSAPSPAKSSAKKSSAKSSSPLSKPGSPEPSSKSDSNSNSSTEAPAHIPRPPNAFILFRSSFIRSQHVSAETEGNHGTLSKIVGMLWHNLSYEERQVWQAKARRAYAEHKRMYPGYSFRPVKDKNAASSKEKDSTKENASKLEREGTPATTADANVTAPPKRKTRTVGPRDLQRCEHIAALLARGLKGAELDAAMKEFDAARAPQTFTPRFEVPLTAQAYAPQKDKDSRKEAKKEVEAVKTERDEQEVITERREKTVEPTMQPPQSIPESDTQTQNQQPAALTILRPRRVRRSSSAPLLDAGMPISAPQPTYPSSHSHFYHPQPQSQQSFQFGQHQEHDFQFGQEATQHHHQAYAQSAFPYVQTTHIQEGIALRKRSASSDAHFRRPSYSFSQPVAHPHLASLFPTPIPQVHDPQPFMQAYSAAHPHLQHMQAQMQAQMRMNGQQESQTPDLGLGLEFEQAGSQVSYDTGYGGQQSGSDGGLSRQSTLTDMSSEVDFSGFSFSHRDAQTPLSAHPTNPNPFETAVPPPPSLSAAPSSSSASVEDMEMEYSYADMPGLVDAPLYHQTYYHPQQQHQQQPSTRSHAHPQLEIQTTWSAEDFTFDQAPTSAATAPPSSAAEVESVPPSAVSGAFEFPPTTPMEMESASAYLSPESSQSVSGATSEVGVRTPIEEAFVASWDHHTRTHTTTSPASVSSPSSTMVGSISSPISNFETCTNSISLSKSATGTDSNAVFASALQAGFQAFFAETKKLGGGVFADEGALYEQFTRGLWNGMSMGGVGVGGMYGEPATTM